MAKSTFKQYANDARKRLSGGFWQDVKQQRKLGQANITIQMEEKSKQANITFNIALNSEEQMYSKVVQMQTGDKVITNPIAQLIDWEYYNNMDVNQRQFYLLKLANDYNRLLKRYNRERNITT